MQKTYVYRKHLKALPKVMLGLMVISIVLIIIGAIFHESFSLGMGIFWLIYSSIFYLFFRRFAQFSIEIREYELFFHKGGKDYHIPYENILSVENASVTNTGGWLKISFKDQSSIRITVVLEDVHLFVLDLKKKLDELELKSLYNEHTLFKFFKTSSYSNESWIRGYYLFPKVFYIFIAGLVISIGGGYFTEQFISIFLIIVIFSIIMLGYALVEFVYFARRHTERMDNQFRAVEHDENNKKVCKIMLYTQLGLTILSLLPLII